MQPTIVRLLEAEHESRHAWTRQVDVWMNDPWCDVTVIELLHASSAREGALRAFLDVTRQYMGKDVALDSALQQRRDEVYSQLAELSVQRTSFSTKGGIASSAQKGLILDQQQRLEAIYPSATWLDAANPAGRNDLDVFPYDVWCANLFDVRRRLQALTEHPDWQRATEGAPAMHRLAVAQNARSLAERAQSARQSIDNAITRLQVAKAEADDLKALHVAGVEEIEGAAATVNWSLPRVPTVWEFVQQWHTQFPRHRHHWRKVAPHWHLHFNRNRLVRLLARMVERANGGDDRSTVSMLRDAMKDASLSDVPTLTALDCSSLTIGEPASDVMALTEPLWLNRSTRLFVRVSNTLIQHRKDNTVPVYLDMWSLRLYEAPDVAFATRLRADDDPAFKRVARRMLSDALLELGSELAAARQFDALAPAFPAHTEDNIEPLVQTQLAGPERLVQASQAGLSNDQRHTLMRASEGLPVMLVTGPAGTGKSFLIDQLRVPPNTLVAAPTGLAALNVAGVTLHSLFQLPATLVDTRMLKPMERDGRFKALQACTRLIIDEISMVRADVLDGVDYRLREARGDDSPFGGVQLIMVGDPFQLPPVLTSADRRLFRKRLGYPAEHFFNARCLAPHHSFASPEWHCQLSTQHRQSHDSEFRELLGRFRTGCTTTVDLQALNERVVDRDRVSPDALFLCARNSEARLINAERLAALKGPSGEFFGRGEWPAPQLPAESHLSIRPGARVVLTRNDEFERWVNGSRGTVIAWDDHAIRVALDGRGVVSVERSTWKLLSPFVDEADGLINYHVEGWYVQFPLQLSWALTIHKSQGMTLHDIAIDLGTGGFATGQVYVALSRVKRHDQLVLTQPINQSDVLVDNRVARFVRGSSN